MSQIIADAAANEALVRELCSGRKLLDEMQGYREYDAAREAQAQRGTRTVGALGKPVLSVPQREWFALREQYGEGCWQDRGFIRDMQKLAPDLAIFKA